jgi:hypothetical protein
MTHSAIGSCSRNLTGMSRALYAGAEFILYLNALYHSLKYSSLKYKFLLNYKLIVFTYENSIQKVSDSDVRHSESNISETGPVSILR